MRKPWMLVVPMLLLVCAGTALAGGRARVVAMKAPESVEAGKQFDVTFEIRHELGRRRDIAPTVVASLDGAEMRFDTVKTPRGYGAQVALPRAGRWQIRVSSQYCVTVMPSRTIQARVQS